MTVVADYTYCKSSGSTTSPPYDVDFIDISTGSPDGWFWDFGDGESSNEQHPLHTYAVAGPHICVLTAFETSGITTTKLENANFVTRRFKDSTPPSFDNPAEHTQFLAASWTDSGSWTRSLYYLHRAGLPITGYFYFASEGDYQYDLSLFPSSSNVAYLEGKTVSINKTIEGVIELSGLNKFMAPPPTPIDTFKFIADFSSYLGDFTPQFGIQDKNQAFISEIPLLAVGDRSGWILESRVIIQPFASMDTESKTIFDLANAINFSANPVAGPNTLSSTFTNLSPITHATRSWLRRVTGSGAVFVEFSTAVAPVEIFDKDSP